MNSQNFLQAPKRGRDKKGELPSLEQGLLFDSYKTYGQVSHELTFHDLALSFPCLRSNRLGGRLHYGQPIT